MSLALFPPAVPVKPAPPPRRRGRPIVALDPAQRAVHIECARYRLLHKVPVARLAAALDVSERTVHRWTAAALSYDDIPAVILRGLAERN